MMVLPSPRWVSGKMLDFELKHRPVISGTLVIGLGFGMQTIENKLL
jgi:hypothetical protein